MCGEKSATIVRITRTYGKGKNLLVIEDVPVLRCAGCGESYFTAETLHELERLKLHKDSLSSKRSVKTMKFA
jgi:YgiT-type zinc finger domain-containing protein